MEYLIGIDIGTSGCKAAVFDPSGSVVAQAREDYKLYSPRKGYMEQDAAEWWAAARSCIKRVLKSSEIDPARIAGVGVTGQFPSLVAVDESGAPLRRAIIYSDMRGEKQSRVLFERLGFEKARSITGFPASIFPGLPVTKILWLLENEPGIARRVWMIMGAKDYINYKLTGEAATDFFEAWWTGLADYQSYSWSVEILKALEIPGEWLPKIRSPLEVIGYVSREASQETGLEEGTPVVCGTGDGFADIIGSGLAGEGEAMDIAGTTEIIATLTSRRMPPSIGDSIFTWRHLIEGYTVVYSSTAASGASLQWLREKLGRGEDYEELTREAEDLEPGGGLIFLPYLSGEYAPFFDPRARGALIGITVNTERKHIVRAVLEGVAFSLNHVLEAYSGLGLRIERIRVGGGGARSRLWNRIKADVTGKELLRLRVVEASSLGAAILSSVGSRIYPSLEEAVESMVSVEEVLKPDPENHRRYLSLYQIYKKIYPALRSIFEELGSMDM